MRDTRIKVLFDPESDSSLQWLWNCEGCSVWDPDAYGQGATAAAAADAGREHLRAAHPEVVWSAGGSVYGKQPRYSRPCGVSVASCGAQTCRCVSVDPGSENGPEEPARAFAPCDRPDCPICATRNALQTTHNESREGC